MNKLSKFLYDSLTDVSAPIWLAVSGGMDSMALLHAASQIRDTVEIAGVVHVNHGLDQHSDEWAELLRSTAEGYGFAVRVLSVTINSRSNLEAQAREARYQAMAKALPTNAAIILAHHHNDQCETFLYRALRGSGLHGLTGMRLIKELFGLHLIRPWLDVTKPQIKAYVVENQIVYVEDPSNHKDLFERNVIRKQCASLFNEGQMAITIENLQRQSALLATVVHEHLERMCLDRYSVCLARLLRMTPMWQYELLHTWVYECSGVRLSLSQMEALVQMLHADTDRYPEFVLPGVTLRRYRNVLSMFALPNQVRVIQTKKTSIVIEGIGKIENPKGLLLRIHIGEVKTKGKRAYQSQAIPVWLRNSVPHIYFGQQLLVGNRGDASLRQDVSWLPDLSWQVFLAQDKVS